MSKEILPGELYSETKMIGKLPSYIMQERYQYSNEKELNGIKVILNENRQHLEQNLVELGCSNLESIDYKEKGVLYVKGEFSRFSLDELLSKTELDEELRGALAYSLANLVDGMHKKGIYHNNITTERVSIYEDGTICLLSNYYISSKNIRPSVRQIVPSAIIQKSDQNRGILDAYETAIIIHNIFTGEKFGLTSFSGYKQNNEMQRGALEALRKVMHTVFPGKKEDFTRPDRYKRNEKMPKGIFWMLRKIFDGKNMSEEKINTTYLTNHLRKYEKHIPRLTETMTKAYETNYPIDMGSVNAALIKN